MAEQLTKRGKDWYYRYTDAEGIRRMRKGCTDKRETSRMAATAEIEQSKIKARLIDPRELAYRDHRDKPLSIHISDWTNALSAKGATAKHVELFTGRARRVVALLMGAKLSEIDTPKNAKRAAIPGFEVALSKWLATARIGDLTAERVQSALATLKAEGRALATCNHHRAAIKAFSSWCHDTHRTNEDALRGVTGFNAKEDRRHDRRTVSLSELQKLIDTAQHGSTFMGMTGPARSLSYRLAVATGLRYSEIGSILPESFDWDAPSVTVPACYTKNGDPATLPLPVDLVDDLATHAASVATGTAIFPLPIDKGAKMLRRDLEAAGIPYRDKGGLVFDFHSLRCELATLADAAGISPRIVQKMMRHSTLELTGRYTRPRSVDIVSAASMLPSLKPSDDSAKPLVMTDTDSIHVQTLAPSCIQFGDASVRSGALADVMAVSGDNFSPNEKTPGNQGFIASVRSESSVV